MFFPDNFTLDLLTRALVLGPAAVLWVVALVNLVGLRSFSKMTAFDFVITVAAGSLLAQAAAADSWPKFLQAGGALFAILAIQWVIALLRRSSERAEDAISNSPLLLMRDGEFLREAMAKARVAESDIRAKLREANVMRSEEIRAVVLETTGDISVLHGETLDDGLLDGVRDA